MRKKIMTMVAWSLLTFSLPAFAPAREQRIGLSSLATLLSIAKPGDTVKVPAGVYWEDVRVPSGVSLQGYDPQSTLLFGSLSISGTESHDITLSGLTLVHDGDRSSVLLEVGGKAVVEHCLLVSNGGFATINLGDRADVLVRNCILRGPLGDYALFVRGGGRKLRLVNCHVEMRGFGVGLMDGGFADIRNCLFYGSHAMAVIQTSAHCRISYCNVYSGSAGGEYNQEWFRNESATGLNDPVPGIDIGSGLTHHSQETFFSKRIEEFHSKLPTWAKHAGDPAKEFCDPDGNRNTLGAFGGPHGAWPGQSHR